MEKRGGDSSSEVKVLRESKFLAFEYKEGMVLMFFLLLFREEIRCS